jgi:hypothetical protein
MSSISNGESRSPKSFRATASRAARIALWSRRSMAAGLAVGGLGLFASGAGALPVSIGGSPLTVNIDERGQCQTSYAASGGNFYPGDQPTGDCGLFIATPSAPSDQPKDLKGQVGSAELEATGRVFGFHGHAGPDIPVETEYTPISNGPASGSGTAADPYQIVTVYDVNDNTLDEAGTANNAVLEITQTSTYVSGNPYFTAYYDVKNVTNLIPTKNKDPDTNSTIYYRAIYAGDLYVNGNDHGTGVFLAGPPRFVGGQNQTSGVIGGFQEDLQGLDGSPTPEWSSFAEDYWDTTEAGTGGIWRDVLSSANAPSAFPNSVSPEDWDNGAGVAWDTNYTEGHGLKPGEDQKYSIVNVTAVPSTLQVSPITQGVAQGSAATINVTALNTSGQPYANTPLRYTIAGVNPQNGVVATNAAGVAQIKYTGANVGVDQIAMYLDLGNTGTQVAADPTGGAQVTFVPVPPNSSVTIQKVHVNTDGSITITYVPSDPGTGTLTVTVPTASVAKKAKAKKCKKGQIKLKGHCLPKTSVVGAVSGKGTPGVPLTLTVKPSGKSAKALKKGHSLRVVATLTYQSAKGGAPSVHVYHETLKLKKKAKAHKKKK